MDDEKLTCLSSLIQMEMTEAEWRFWAKVGLAGDCWEWRGAILHGGYGAFYYNGKTHSAHRLAWLFTYGELPSSDV
jgi:hypothetical protein